MLPKMRKLIQQKIRVVLYVTDDETELLGSSSSKDYRRGERNVLINYDQIKSRSEITITSM